MSQVPAAQRVAVRIEPMRVDHLPEVQRIDALVYPSPWSAALWRQELAQPDVRTYVVALAGDVVLGHAGLMQLADEGHVSTVAVDPTRWGLGVGARLVSALAHDAIARGVHAMTLEVRVSNARAIELYRRFGFAPAGVRRNYYTDVVEDALIMWAYDVHLPGYAHKLRMIDEALANGAASQQSATAPAQEC